MGTPTSATCATEMATVSMVDTVAMVPTVPTPVTLAPVSLTPSRLVRLFPSVALVALTSLPLTAPATVATATDMETDTEVDTVATPAMVTPARELSAPMAAPLTEELLMLITIDRPELATPAPLFSPDMDMVTIHPATTTDTVTTPQAMV